ncbi:MAG: hypothetical protein RH859_11680 [Longimicrobiales bacterium]
MSQDPAPGTHRVPAQATLFGFDPTDAVVVVRPRPRRWRMMGALRIGGVALVVAPIVALLPPHAPWALGALGLGALLVRRRLQERFTVEGVDGVCPRCGEPLTAAGGRLRMPHPATCEACNNEPTLTLEAGALDVVPAA